MNYTPKSEGSGSNFAIIASVVSSIGAALVTGIFTYLATKKPENLIHLQVIPLEMSHSDFPLPVVKINNEVKGSPYNFNISGESSVVIDVNDALNSFKIKTKSLETATANIQTTKQYVDAISVKIEDIEKLNQQLSQLNKFTLGDVCPGGASGTPLPHAAMVANIIDNLNSQLQNIKGSLSKAAQ